MATDVVLRVLRDKAYAAAALDAELERNVQLDARDRALATELSYGTLRLLGWLEQRIGKHATKGVRSIEHHVRAHLLVAAYQVLVLTRVPAFAAVDEAVTSIRALRGARVAGFANAVLRKLSGEPKPDPQELARASLDAADPAIAAAMIRAVGREATIHLLSAEETPALGVRVEDASARDLWLARLRQARPEASIEPGRVSPLAIVARGAGRLTDLPGWAEGAWTSQEEGSQFIALALGARPGDRVLDACAGRGNKTGILARAVLGFGADNTSGGVDAADLHASKLERLRTELDRIGLRPKETFVVDWTAGRGAAKGPYDRVLVDAPCSGIGTVRRRPELLLRRREADLEALAKMQRAIVEHAASVVRPGGRLVYAVCSVFPEEAEEVVRGAEAFGLMPAPFDAEIVSLVAPREATSFRLLPHMHGTDGYFIASFLKT